jgi:tRNA(adenine34) deaminase
MSTENDILFMQKALYLAKIAALEKEIPVGAIICDNNGDIISEAHNLVEKVHFAGAHAEVLAIEAAGKKLNTWRLKGCTLYVTLEPCPMCTSLAVLSRIPRIVFGCHDPRMGAAGSLFNLAEHPDLPHHIDITGGILEDECKALMQDFFQSLRNRKKNLYA